MPCLVLVCSYVIRGRLDCWNEWISNEEDWTSSTVFLHKILSWPSGLVSGSLFLVKVGREYRLGPSLEQGFWGLDPFFVEMKQKSRTSSGIALVECTVTSVLNTVHIQDCVSSPLTCHLQSEAFPLTCLPSCFPSTVSVLSINGGHPGSLCLFVSFVF